jgi:hypothetical protein
VTFPDPDEPYRAKGEKIATEQTDGYGVPAGPGEPIIRPTSSTKTHLTDDPFWLPAYDKAIKSIEDLLLGGGSLPVRRADAPLLQPTEFSWGQGRMAPPDLADPSPWDQMRAIYRTDPADATSEANYEGEYRP